MLFLFSKKNYNSYTVPITIQMSNGESIEREYTVDAKNEEQAIQRASILARIDSKNENLEDKSLALIHRGKWYNPFRFRLYKRGFSKIFLNAGHNTGTLLKISTDNFKKSVNSHNDDTNTQWDKERILKCRKNCILSIGWYGALLIVGIFYLYKGLISNNYIFFTFFKPALIAGFVLTFISIAYLYRSWRHFGILTNMLLESSGENV